MVDVGQKMRFVPSWNKNAFDDEQTIKEKSVIGKVIYVNRQHKQFTVKYPCGGTKQKETFKFSEIGKTIHYFRR